MKILAGLATATEVTMVREFDNMAEAISSIETIRTFFVIEESEHLFINFDGLTFTYDYWGFEFFLEAERHWPERT